MRNQSCAGVAEPADAQVSKTCIRKGVRVRLPPPAYPFKIKPIDAAIDRRRLAYVIGLAIGDGNLSNPNGRATRLRITCHTRHKVLVRNICEAIQAILPKNKINIVNRSKNYLDVSCYSNRWENWLGWKAGKGSKAGQNVSVPDWILNEESFLIPCLRGLFETDGSIYRDRGYLMMNFVSTIQKLALDVLKMVSALGFKASLSAFSSLDKGHRKKYTVRICQNAASLIEVLGISKE